jgi:predicted oxidoreductase
MTDLSKNVICSKTNIENEMTSSKFIAGYWRLHSWCFTTQQLVAFVEQHMELGINSVDHAWIYQSEKIFGKAIKLSPSLRNQLHIISKCGIKPGNRNLAKSEPFLYARETSHYSSNAKTIITSCEQSLTDLNTDYIDLLLLHRPDYLMPIDEIANAFDKLKSSGKVKHFGVSNFSRDQFKLLQSGLNIPLVTNQIEFSPMQTSALDSGVLEQSQINNIGIMAWSCLAGGDLFRSDSEQAKRVRSTLQLIAEEIGADNIEQVVYAWLLKHPCKIYPMIGSSKIERYKNAVKSLQLNLDHEHWYQILEASRGCSVD